MDREKLVVLTIDAGEYDFIQQWAEEGFLPNIKRIMDDGIWGKVVDDKIIGEHGAGRSLFCGVPHDVHGYYYFRQLKPGTYEIQVESLHELCPKPFWAYLTGKVAVIDPVDTPIVDGLDGVQVNNWNKSQPNQRILEPRTYPKSLLEEINKICPSPKKWEALKLNATEKEEKEALAEFISRMAKQVEVCQHVFAKDDFELYCVSFSEAHIGAHRFWDYMRLEKYQNHPLRNAIREIYQKLDAHFGDMIKKLPQDANIFILSPNGMKAAYPMTSITEDFCRKLGYQTNPQASGSGRKFSLNPLSLARKVLPKSIRQQISKYLPLKMQEQAIATAIRDSTDWSKTTAFSLQTLYTSVIRINLKGREPKGTVEVGDEYNKLLDSLEKDFKLLIDPVTGESPVEKIVRTVDDFGCSPHEWLPDMFVIWKPCDHFVAKLIHPKAELTQARPEYYRSSYHSYHGFLAASGPSIPQLGNIGEVSHFDIAPTLLALQNVEIPEQFVGKPVSQIIKR